MDMGVEYVVYIPGVEEEYSHDGKNENQNG